MNLRIFSHIISPWFYHPKDNFHLFFLFSLSQNHVLSQVHSCESGWDLLLTHGGAQVSPHVLGYPPPPSPPASHWNLGPVGQDIPSCFQPRLLAGSGISTELPKQGLKHFPGKTTSSMPCYGCQLCLLQPVFGANLKHQERVPKGFAQGWEPRTTTLEKRPLPWALVVQHEEIKGAGGERGEGCRSLCPPVNHSNSSCGP